MHEARIVASGTYLCPGIEYMTHFIAEHGNRGIGILDGESASEAATFLCGWQLNQIDTTYRS
jgi:hypothetical protein